MIKHNRILLPFVHGPHHNRFLHPSHDESCDIEANSHNECIDHEQPPVQTPIYGTLHLCNHLASKPISNEYFNIVNDEIDLWSLMSVEEEY